MHRAIIFQCSTFRFLFRFCNLFFFAISALCGKAENFENIKRFYAVADMESSRKLSEVEIINKSNSFIPMLKKLFLKDGDRAIDFISRKGRKLDENQITSILNWLN